MERELNIVSHSEEQTLALAEKLGPHLRNPEVIVLTGPLGAGKTVFVKGLAAGLGLDRDKVNSPSFTMVNEYPGPNPLFHFDLYRLEDPSELRELGWDDYMTRDGVFVVEWGEKAGGYLPDTYYRIEFIILSDHERNIIVTFVKP